MQPAASLVILLVLSRKEASLQQGQGFSSHGLIDPNCLDYQEITGLSKIWLFRL